MDGFELPYPGCTAFIKTVLKRHTWGSQKGHIRSGSSKSGRLITGIRFPEEGFQEQSKNSVGTMEPPFLRQLKLEKLAQQVIPITAQLDKRGPYALTEIVMPEKKVWIYYRRPTQRKAARV